MHCRMGAHCYNASRCYTPRCTQVRPAGSCSMLRGPAVSEEELWRALDVGAEAVRRAVAGGCDGGEGGAAGELPADWRQCVVLLGEVGIGNTTAAAALLAALTGAAPEEVVGRGTGGCSPGVWEPQQGASVPRRAQSGVAAEV